MVKHTTPLKPSVEQVACFFLIICFCIPLVKDKVQIHKEIQKHTWRIHGQLFQQVACLPFCHAYQPEHHMKIDKPWA